ncbi:UNVERIFIED_CONTAM: Alpha-L-arabinofuranosidase 1 [Sesamum radiatum]|uniref:non-reducing end alpha-L-arabinofuranosidase n=1 Tax=Sesamum radiatum TaxID=300843 RepID=A0AAW2NQI5_SESRA
MLFPLLVIVNGMTIRDVKESQIYIVYLGDKPQQNHKCIAESHDDILASAVGSKEEAKKLMVYNYKHSFSGFAAKLTKAQAKKLAEKPGVLQVLPDGRHRVQNTRSWISLGLSNVGLPNNLLHQAHMGDGVIVGVVDSGIWPDSAAFNDEGLGPVPARWKGVCKSDGLFMPPSIVIGKISEPRWRRVASSCRLAIYKACWDAPKGLCSSSDILAAMDDAVRDGVDVISVSLGGKWGSTTPASREVAPWMISVAASTVDRAFPTPITLGNNKTIMGHGLVIGKRVGFTGLVQEDLPKSSAGGNGGPTTSSVEEVAPWMISVAASTVDRAFPTPITLGNNKTIMVIGYHTGTAWSLGKGWFTGWFKRISLRDYADQYPIPAVQVADSGGLALIIVRPLDDTDLYAYSDSMQHPITRIPIVEVDFEAGNQILEYIEKSYEPTVMIGPSSVLVGKPLTPKVAGFSSRGPNALAPQILKPDVAAPGASILAAVPPGYPANDNGFAFMSGTSMAAPHVGGIVALLRALHPHWSPAAIKSALITTAWNEDSHMTPIFCEGSPAKIADPFDYGGGIVNPNGAAYPAEQLICQNRYISLIDLNFPSIEIPALKTSITVKRRVTNVGPSNSVYRATVKHPIGTVVSVKPEVLVFDSNTTTIDFEVTVDAEENMNTGPDSMVIRKCVRKSSKKDTETMFGISFEEINHAGAGGLWAELVSNRGFEAGGQNTPSNISPWSILGDESLIFVSTDRSSCFDRNRIALRMEVLCNTDGGNICPAAGVGVYNPGFWGMNIEQGKTYKVTFYVRSMQPIEMSVSLIGSNGLQKLATADVIDDNVTNWTKKEILLQAAGTDPNSRLQLTTRKKGTIWLDQVSAMPLSTHKGHGFRQDLFNMLADLKPGFIRFPGGSFVEGDWLVNAFRWKETVGAGEERPGHFGDVWQYWTDDGLGYFEYLQLAEDLGALPVWVFNNGISHNNQVDSSVILPFVQDILDAIEFARGDPTSTWGSVRAAMGHAEPFDLRYVAVGNQDCGNKNYRGNYMKFYTAIKGAYPDIKIISNCDGSTRQLDHPADLYDFHVYTNANSMFSMAHNFDHTSRSGPKAFVSEYAVTGNDAGRGSLLKALAEAAFLLGLEGNSDVVEMASNAPLFVNANDGESNGAILLNSKLQANSSSSIIASAISWKNPDNNRSYLRIKVVNFGSNRVSLKVSVDGLDKNSIEAAGSTITTLMSSNAMAENSFSEPRRWPQLPVNLKMPATE